MMKIKLFKIYIITYIIGITMPIIDWFIITIVMKITTQIFKID